MKKITIIAALAALAFTACEKNVQTPFTDSQEVKFVMDEVVTRVTTTGNVTTFVDNDQIAITSAGLYADIANETYTYTSAGLDGKSVLFKETGDASFVAHYPSSLSNVDGSIEMTVPAAQTAENFHDNMFMVATATGNAENPVVSLQFAHQLAWVKIVLDGIEGTSVVLNNVKPTVTWTSSSLEASGEATDITAYKQAGQEYWALVPAQTVVSETKLVTVETADKVYEYTLAADLVLTTAKVKTITLSIDPSSALISAAISVDSANDITWTDDAELEDYVTEKPAEPLFLISAEDGSFSSLNTKVTGIANISATGWTPVINVQSGADRGVITTEGGTASIIPASGVTGNSWYNLALVYRTETDVPAGKTYTLTFTLDTEGEGNVSGLNIRFLQPSVTPGNVIWASDFKTQTNTGVISSDITLYNTGTKDSNATISDSDISLSDGLLVVFGVNGNDGITYKISNVTLKEKVVTE